MLSLAQMFFHRLTVIFLIKKEWAKERFVKTSPSPPTPQKKLERKYNFIVPKICLHGIEVKL